MATARKKKTDDNAATPDDTSGGAQPAASSLQRPPAEVLYADQLAQLAGSDADPRPPGWALSLKAARSFILGHADLGIAPKIVAPVASIERMLVSLATGRGLMLVGEPGTAKSMLSELLAAAISGDSTLTIQGGASITEDQIKYGWNYALLINEGPSPRALVPAPLYQGMNLGKVVRFEEITRAPLEVQDCLLGMLSDRVLAVPELEGEHAMLYAREGFNIIATANTRDRGVNEMSAALKRRFDFETVFPIMDFDREMALVQSASTRLLAQSGIPHTVPQPIVELLVTTFRDLRGAKDANAGKGQNSDMDKLTAVMSTAEAVNVAHAVGVRAWFLEQREGSPADLVDCIAGTVVKDNADDRAKLRRYFEQKAAKKQGAHWQAYYQARHRLP
jgi:MoxR-like ATPase